MYMYIYIYVRVIIYLNSRPRGHISFCPQLFASGFLFVEFAWFVRSP